MRESTEWIALVLALQSRLATASAFRISNALMIIAIDGPAGAGKSTIARRLAERLGFRFLDTGAMYRAVALLGLRRGLDWSDEAPLVELAHRHRIEMTEDAIFVDGEDVSQAIRTPTVTAVTRHAANCQAVRQHLVGLQRSFGLKYDTVTEGRDQGTVVFPDAEVKVFLTATPEERARRRSAELARRGESVAWPEILRQQNRRDAEDAAREYGGLRKADDAFEVLTDGLTIDQVVDRLEDLARSRLPARHDTACPDE